MVVFWTCHATLPEQEPVKIRKADIQQPHVTAPGPDMIHTYWLKKQKALHDPLAAQIQRMLRANTRENMKEV